MKSEQNTLHVPVVYILVILFVSFISPNMTGAGLLPEETAVLVNANSPDSLRIGELYIRLRHVPADHVIIVDVSSEEAMSRVDYDELIAGPVRDALKRLNANEAKIRCLVTTYGIPVRINAVKPVIMPAADIEQFSMMKKNMQTKLDGLTNTGNLKKDQDRELHKEIDKMKSEIGQLTLKIMNLEGFDTLAAVDSELALVLVPDYPLAGWRPNPDYLYNMGKIDHYGQVLMISRLDAPTPELAEDLVRTAVEVEREGLSGKIYLDARGKKGDDAYSRFDESIRIAAKVLRGGTMPVILDNRPGLFGKGEAVSAALYCGWYSLGKYVDAFAWSKGAVAYHVASVEARTLHSPEARNWVKRMIEEGVIATLGPVEEPYLDAFPLPSVFFPLLMSGRYTLAEVFAMTNPYLSWRMILVGDPLYNPFKAKPAFMLKDPPPAP